MASKQRTALQEETAQRLRAGRAALAARVTAMDPDHRVLPADLPWDRYANLVREG
jgi:hypothetical protein